MTAHLDVQEAIREAEAGNFEEVGIIPSDQGPTEGLEKLLEGL